MLYPLSYQGADRQLYHQPVLRGLPLRLHVCGTGSAAHRCLSARSGFSAGVSLDNDRGGWARRPCYQSWKNLQRYVCLSPVSSVDALH